MGDAPVPVRRLHPWHDWLSLQYPQPQNLQLKGFLPVTQRTDSAGRDPAARRGEPASIS